MNRFSIPLALLLLPTSLVLAEAETFESKVERLGLFKNGLAVVTRTIDMRNHREGIIENVPEPVHGTFWIESESEIVARIHTQEREANQPLSYHQAYEGKRVTVYFVDPDMSSISGIVLPSSTPSELPSPPQGHNPFGRSYSPVIQPNGFSEFLILETRQGREYIRTHLISRISSTASPHTGTKKQTVLHLSSDEPINTVKLHYLSKGISWAPSYRVDLDTQRSLTLSQKAIIQNEWEDVEEAEVFLISGFPNVEFSHVTSLLSPSQTWANFFQQLNTTTNGRRAPAAMVQVNVARAEMSSPASLSPPGEELDVHYYPAGILSLKKGETLSLPTGKASTSYRSVVEWTVPDLRDENGRRIQDYHRQQNPEKYEDAAWDALEFSNPLDFPMTTGPILIAEGNRFLGQSLSTWVNPDQETTVQITKALSLKTKSSAQEVEGSRTQVKIGSSTYTKSMVEGSLEMKNLRNTPQAVIVRRKVSGELLEVSDNPETTLLEEGVWSVNPRNELVWKLTLRPDEEKTLTYRYSVLTN